MRLKLSAGLIVVLGIAGGAATLAQAQKLRGHQASESTDNTLISVPTPGLLGVNQAPPQPPDLTVPAEVTIPAASAPDDPMDVVESFVQRNRKEAEDAVRSLTEERTRLRQRLQKVESALLRWEKVSRAFADEGQVAPQAAESPPLDLRPIESDPVEVPK
jgi:uncharacterized protein YheU (UPF0270 family)